MVVAEVVVVAAVGALVTVAAELAVVRCWWRWQWRLLICSLILDGGVNFGTSFACIEQAILHIK